MKLYQPNGYANMHDIILESETPFCLVIGGRGTGKTYNAIKTCLEEHIKFVYLRRTSAQMELISKDEFSPIVKIGADIGKSLCCAPLSKYATGVYELNAEGKPTGAAIAVNMSLTGVSNMRSFNAESFTTILYDEAIPEKHEKRISHESEAFLQMYESLDRNRQLCGQPPIKCIVMANANNMEAAILQALNCVRTLDRMKKKHQTQYIDRTLGLSVYLLNDSPISAEKRETALYKLTMGEGDFADMALNNAFSKDNYTDIGSRPLSEYNPVAAIGNICLYRHKSTYHWYVSETRSGKPKEFENTLTDRQRFRKYAIKSWQDYFDKKLTFENVNAKVFYRAIMLENMR